MLIQQTSQSNSKGDINYQSLIKRVLHDEGWLEDQTKTDK